MLNVKKIIILSVGILLCFCMACSKKLTTYTEINYSQYIKKLENKETFPLVIGSSSCSACAIYKGTMETFIKNYQVEVFYIDLSTLSEEDYLSLQAQTSFEGTPTTIFIENGNFTSFYNRIDGSQNLTNVISFFENNQYIN